MVLEDLIDRSIAAARGWSLVRLAEAARDGWA